MPLIAEDSRTSHCSIERRIEVKLKTKLLITFLIIVFVPLSLIGFAFWLIKLVAFYTGAGLCLHMDPGAMEDLQTEMGMLIAPNFMACMIVAIVIILIGLFLLYLGIYCKRTARDIDSGKYNDFSSDDVSE